MTATTRPVIDRFDREHAFLSNFHPCKVEYQGRSYRSVEHALQAAKTVDPRERIAIAGCPTPGQAKRAGRTATLRQDWELVKDGIMMELLISKFRDPELSANLLATGDAELVEGNHWGDTYWGRVGTVGRNRLGVLLMGVRSVLWDEAEIAMTPLDFDNLLADCGMTREQLSPV